MQKLILALAALFIFGCKTTKNTILESSVDERLLDTLMVTAPKISKNKTYELDPFNPSEERKIDLIHTALDLSFDWNKQHVIGKAMLRLRPYFYDITQVELDAVGFDIKRVKMFDSDLKYKYDGYKLVIELERNYSRDNLIELDIDYVAKPEETPAGGSDAITSEKGLFFINPLNADPNKPQQIWTQGETENNSRWFPTVDKPNERCSQEIRMTVEDRFATLSNGRLVSSTKNNDGTRTDYWKQDKPHAPYLFMVGVGEYAVVTEKVNGLDLMYYVEPKYKEDAKLIFNHTPEMIAFFSEKLNYPYPWDKYAQIICRDFVSGAMENTGAVTFGDFVQRTKKQLVDADNDYIVAHELFHHWFGDLVTCESWANLTMNEGFANYSEYLWFEHKYGEDRANHHRENEIGGYLGSLQRGGAHPLIHYGYDDKEQMFDAHSYNKGGLVLHMLRDLVGDDAFYHSLNKYLTDNEYSAVEADELRLAFEDVTGKDLIWFFDQWYFEAGHPQLNVNYTYQNDSLQILIEQTQDPEKYPPIFILPTTIAIYDVLGNATKHKVVIDQRKQTYSFPYKGDYAWASIDADDILLAEVSSNKSKEQYGHQFLASKNYREQILALNEIEGMPTADVVYEEALNNDYYNIRRKAINELSKDEKFRDKIENLAVNDPHSIVRSTAINYLKEMPPFTDRIPEIVKQMKTVIKNDESYRPANAALSYIYSLLPNEGLELCEKLEDHPDNAFDGTITDIYIESKDEKYLPKLFQQLDQAEGVGFYFASQKLLPYFKERKDAEKLKAAQIYLAQTQKSGPPFIKFISRSAVNELKSSLSNQAEESIKQAFEDIIKVLPE